MTPNLDQLQKENWHLKMKCYAYEERLKEIGLHGSTGASLQACCERLFQLNEELERTISDEREKSREARRKCVKAEAAAAHEKQLRKIVQDGAQKLADSNAWLLQQVGDLKKVQEQQRQSATETAAQLTQLKAQLERKRAAAASMMARLEEEQQGATDAATQLTQLEAQLTQLEAQLERERAEAASMKARLEEERQGATEAATQLTQLEAQLQRESAEAASMKARLEEERQGATEAATQLTQLEAQLQRESAEAASMKARLEEERQGATEAATQLTQLTAQLQREREARKSLEAAWNRSLCRRRNVNLKRMHGEPLRDISNVLPTKVERRKKARQSQARGCP